MLRVVISPAHVAAQGSQKVLIHCSALWEDLNVFCTAVIKPIYGAASIGVVRVDSADQLEKTYHRVQEEMSGAKIVDGALVQGTDPKAGVSTLFTRIVEHSCGPVK